MSANLGHPMPWYVDHGGDGPVLVLLHAFPLSSSMWDRLVPLLAPHARVVTIDLPGLGDSKQRDDEPSMPHLQQSVVAVLDELGVDRATFVGLSAGGYVALEVAALAPERMHALVLGSSTCWVTDPDIPDARRWLAAELERTGSVDPLQHIPDEVIGASAKAQQPELIDEVRRVVAANDPDGVAWFARAVASRHDTSVTLRELDRPVLLLFGEEDDLTSPDRFAWAMNGMRGGESGATRLEILPGTGHLTALEQPEKVAAALLDWLAHYPA